MPIPTLPTSGLTHGNVRTAVEALIARANGEMVSVKDNEFGAKGDDVTNDTAALQAAFNSGRPVFIPPGTYRHTGLTVPNHAKIVGAGIGLTFLKNTSTTAPSLDLKYPGGSDWRRNWLIEDLTLTCATVRTANQVGVDMNVCHSGTMRNVNIINHGYGVREKATWACTFDTLYCTDNIVGYFIDQGDTTPGVPNYHANCHIRDNTQGGIDMKLNGQNASVWIGGQNERNPNYGARIVGSSNRSISFIGVNFEGNGSSGGYDIILGATGDTNSGPASILFQGCQFQNEGATRRAINCIYGAGLTVQNCHFAGNFDRVADIASTFGTIAAIHNGGISVFANSVDANTTIPNDTIAIGTRTDFATFGAAGITFAQYSGNTKGLKLRNMTEASESFHMDYAGTMKWHPWNTANPDTTLGRSAANELAMGTGDSFKVDGTWNGGTIILGTTRIWIDGNGQLRIKNGAPTSATDGTAIGAAVGANYFTRPFASNSAWNVAIPSHAIRQSLPLFGALTGNLSSWEPNTYRGSVTVYQASESDPLRNVRYANTWANLNSGTWKHVGNTTQVEADIMAASSVTFPYPYSTYASQVAGTPTMPAAYRKLINPASDAKQIRSPSIPVVTYGTDGQLVIYQPDGSVFESYATIVLSDGTIVCMFYNMTDPAGAGDGWENGTAASMLPIYGGLIRQADLNAGVINHALHLGLPAGSLALDFVHPALAFDTGALSESPPYSGIVPMGARLALPATTDINTLCSTAEGRLIAAAFKTYGGIVVDRGGSSQMMIKLEEGASHASFPNIATWHSGTQADLDAIIDNLQIVSLYPEDQATKLAVTNHPPVDVTITWRSGFANGAVPGATASGTVIADLSTADLEGDAIAYTLVGAPNGGVAVSGATLVTSGSLTTGVKPFAITAKDIDGNWRYGRKFVKVGQISVTGSLVNDTFESGAINAWWTSGSGTVDTTSKITGANTYRFTGGGDLTKTLSPALTGKIRITWKIRIDSVTTATSGQLARLELFKSHPNYVIFWIHKHNSTTNSFRFDHGTSTTVPTAGTAVTSNTNYTIVAELDMTAGTYSFTVNGAAMGSGSHSLTSLAEIHLGPKSDFQAANFRYYIDDVVIEQL